MKEVELKKIKEEGAIPNYKSMFSNEEIELVNYIYSDDIKLYKSHFGDKCLLFWNIFISATAQCVTKNCIDNWIRNTSEIKSTIAPF